MLDCAAKYQIHGLSLFPSFQHELWASSKRRSWTGGRRQRHHRRPEIWAASATDPTLSTCHSQVHALAMLVAKNPLRWGDDHCKGLTEGALAIPLWGRIV